MIGTGLIIDYAHWKECSKTLLFSDISPDLVLWNSESLFAEPPPDSKSPFTIKVPPDFPKLAEEVSCHSDENRWSLLYRILWRITRGNEKHLLRIASDPDIAKAASMEKNVRREIHKMHAFVRFKLISTDPISGKERYAAWFEPEHSIVERATPFFRARFANMDWSIFTPKGCAHWIDGSFSFTEGISQNPIENPDVMESAWNTYYRSIFNPARLKTKMMQTEMPKRYWKNLPEAALIPDLVSKSRKRVDNMITSPTTNPRKAPNLPYLSKLNDMSNRAPVETIPEKILSLDELRNLSETCQVCPLWKNATCTVFGEGPPNARIMIVGEQPGDHEDVAGKPFVGPAGKLLDRALSEAGIDRSEAYVTNAVKHFKWTPRGKHRLHQTPDRSEIEACRPWLLAELKNIQPEVIILLGSTAAKSLIGHLFTLSKHRGIVAAPHLAHRVVTTFHPAYLLRKREEIPGQSLYSEWVNDLKTAISSLNDPLQLPKDSPRGS